MRYQHVLGVLGVPLIFTFSQPYADGGQAAWVSTVATPDGRYVYKVDVRTGSVIANYGFLDDPQPLAPPESPAPTTCWTATTT